MYSSSSTVTTVAPFEFEHSLTYIRGSVLALGEQQADDVLRKAVRILGQTVQFTVRASRPAGSLDIELLADQPLSEVAHAAALDRIRFYLGLDDDVQAFYRLAASDRAFQPVLEALYGYHQVKFLTPFENAAWAILTQRTRTPGARSLKRRLTEAYGDQVGGFWAFPEAADLAAVPEAELAQTLGNARKAAYLSGTARAFAEMDERWLRRAPHAEVQAWLLGLPGVGPFSAFFILMRGLGRGEQLFAFEGPNEGFLREIAQAAEGYYGPLSDAELRQVAEHYGAWQGYWANYLRAAPMVHCLPIYGRAAPQRAFV
jgi:DNA-3-methyladenine glycosylase II